MKIDEKLSKKILDSAYSEENADHRPQRLTASRLLSQHGELGRFFSNKDKFPKTQETLKLVTETTESHLLRNIEWGILQLIAEGHEISMQKLRIKCSVTRHRLDPYIEQIRKITLQNGGTFSRKSKLVQT